MMRAVFAFPFDGFVDATRGDVFFADLPRTTGSQ